MRTKFHICLLCIIIPVIPAVIYADRFSQGHGGEAPGTCSRNLPPGFVDLKEEIPGVIAEIKYASQDNFTGEILDGYGEKCAWGLREMSDGLKKAQEDFIKLGYRIKIFDSYRPVRAETHMIRWGKKNRKYHLMGKYIPGTVSINSRYGHACGNTVDLTLADITGIELDMGTPFDEFSERAHTLNAKGAVLKNRLVLKKVMEKYGFRNYFREWWHYVYTKKPGKPLDFIIK